MYTVTSFGIFWSKHGYSREIAFIAHSGSRIFRILPRLGFVEELLTGCSANFDDLGFEAFVVRILTEHRQLIATLKIGRDKETEFILGINTPTRPEIMGLVDPVETGPTDTNHVLEFLFRRVFDDPVQSDVVDHGNNRKS